MSTTSEPQMDGHGSRGPPPTYGEAADNNTHQSAASILIRSTPGPAGNGKLFLDVPGEPSITFTFLPESTMDIRSQPWCGKMDVKCSDVPLLMRDGFHWTAANVIREEGFIDHFMGKPTRRFPFTRVWVLRDQHQPPRWTASLQVCALDDEVLSGIQLDNWSVDMVRRVEAWGLSRKLIYQFDITKPRHYFYSIYDDMPLKGWWPWPRRDPKRDPKRA
ncbi:hypothetical protein F4818DRAFT_440326 [Hypoxylon cercidicola]|nr:hypothetical protein F4818DRAFT_440326 [Hypoxylon cercidicola]